MDVALEFIEARKRAEAVEHGRRPVVDREEELPVSLDTALVLGLLMTVLPPMAVTLVWSTSRLTRRAQTALTLYGAWMTLVLAAITVAALR